MSTPGIAPGSVSSRQLPTVDVVLPALYQSLGIRSGPNVVLVDRIYLRYGNSPLLKGDIHEGHNAFGCIVIMNEAGPVVAVRRLHSRYKPALVQSYMRKEPAL